LFNKVLYQKCTLKWDVFKVMDKVASDFHTTLARESYCNSGMERHYAGDDYWDDYCTVMSAFNLENRDVGKISSHV
jgi:hypothetical protein